MSPLTIGQALVKARAMGVDRLDAQMMLSRILQRSRSWLVAHDDGLLDEAQAINLQAWLLRRAQGEPLAYVLGEKEFHGLTLHVTSDVLVPRPETELLVDWGLQLLAAGLAGSAPPRVLDLGTGSGAIALAVKSAYPNARVTATDASTGALTIAQRNAQRLGLSVEFRQGNWWECLAGLAFDLILSNPPYIEPDDPHLPSLRHEPRIALTPGRSGLDALAAIVADSRRHLEPGGWLVLEHGHDQAAAVRDLLIQGGFPAPLTRLDLAGLPRCTGAQRTRSTVRVG